MVSCHVGRWKEGKKSQCAKSLEKAVKLAETHVKSIEASGLAHVKPLSKDEASAIDHFKKKNPDTSLSETVREFSSKKEKIRANLFAEEAVEQFVKWWSVQREAGSGSKQYQKAFINRVQRFAKSFKGHKMSSLSEEEVEDWKVGLTDEKTGKLLSCKARNEYLSTIKKLFTFCRLDTVDKLQNLLKENPPKEFYFVSDVEKILDVFRPKKYENKLMHPCYPSVVLSIFAGLRQSEAIVLDWSVLNKAMASKVEKKTFVITESKTDPRQVLMNETLLKWLEIVPEEERIGEVFKTKAKDKQRKQDAFSEQFRNALKGVVRVVKNGLRHSCATYLVAKHNDYQFVADQIGNSVAMQRQHYVTPLTYEEAMEFWNLTPYSEVEELQIELEKERAEKERRARKKQEKKWRKQSKKEVEECIRDTGGIEPLRNAENLSPEDVWEDFYGED